MEFLHVFRDSISCNSAHAGSAAPEDFNRQVACTRWPAHDSENNCSRWPAQRIIATFGTHVSWCGLCSTAEISKRLLILIL